MSDIIKQIQHTTTVINQWAERNGVFAAAFIIAKVSMLAISAFAVGCVVYTIFFGSLPSLTLIMLCKGAIYVVAGVTNLLSCVRLFQKILHPQSVSWNEVAIHVATLFITAIIGVSLCTSFRPEILTITYKFVCFEMGAWTNLAMGVRIFSVMNKALHQKASIKDVIQELAIGIMTTIGIAMLINGICEFELSFHVLSSISAGVIGSGIIAAISAKIIDIVRRAVAIS